jgi:hypothetical protein
MATTSTEFGTSQLFFADARLVFAMLNHLRYQALHSTLGLSREQANVLTAVVLLSAADGAYEATRRIGRLRPHVSGTNAAVGAAAVREASLSLAGPNVRAIPGLGGLVVFALVGRFALPALRRTGQRARAAEQRLRAAEQRVRSERIRRYAAARDRAQSGAA